MRKDAITLTVLAARLEKILHCDVGMNGLNILIHGWIRKGGISRDSLRQRKKRSQVEYLTIWEARAFSKYAGYDLTQEPKP